MGKLVLGPHLEEMWDIDDTLLGHVQLVVVSKFRRREGFLLTLFRSEQAIAVWIHPSSHVRFQFEGSGNIKVDRDLLERLSNDANSNRGLWIDAPAMQAPTAP